MRKILVILSFLFLLVLHTASAAIISGTITDTFKKPLSIASITISRFDTQELIAHSNVKTDGSYQFSLDLSKGLYILSAQAENYGVSEKKIYINTTIENYTQDFELQKILKGTFTFILKNKNNVLLNGTIILTDQNSQTVAITNTEEKKGKTENIPLGNYYIIVNSENYHEYTQKVSMSLSDLNKTYNIQLIPEQKAAKQVEQKKEEVTTIYYDYTRPQFKNGYSHIEWELYKTLIIPIDDKEYKIRLSHEDEKVQTILINPGQKLVNTTLGATTFFDINNDKENDISIKVEGTYQKVYPSGFIDTYANVTFGLLKEIEKEKAASTNVTKDTENKISKTNQSSNPNNSQISDTQNNSTADKKNNPTKTNTEQSKNISDDLSNPEKNTDQNTVSFSKGKGTIFITGTIEQKENIIAKGVFVSLAIIIVGFLVYWTIMKRRERMLF